MFFVVVLMFLFLSIEGILKDKLTLFCSTLILANSGLTCDQPVLLPFLLGRRPPTFPEKRSPDSRFKSRPPFFWKPLSRNKKIVTDSISGKSKVSCTLTTTIVFDLKLEMTQNKSVALFAFTLQEEDCAKLVKGRLAPGGLASMTREPVCSFWLIIQDKPTVK